MRNRFRWPLTLLAVALSLRLLTGASTLINLSSQVQGVLSASDGGTGNTTGQATLTKVSSSLGANVTMNASNFSDGPSVSVTAGTWLVAGQVEVQTTSVTSAINFTCKLWDGTTVAAASYVVIGAVSSAAARNTEIPLSGILTEAGSATAKISCMSTTTSQIMEAAPANNSPGNFSSTISAVRIQ